MFLNLLLMFVLFFCYFIEKFLFGKKPILSVLFKLLFQFLFFSIFGPVYLRFFYAVDILTLIINKSNKLIQCLALPTKSLLFNLLLLFDILSGGLSLHLIGFAGEGHFVLYLRFCLLFLHQANGFQGGIKSRVFVLILLLRLFTRFYF